MHHLPERLEELFIHENSFRGSLEVQGLLKSFNANSNFFKGTINFTQFPINLRYLDVSHNQLWGSADLTSLPEKLLDLSLGNNKFCGTTDLRSLPETLQELSLGKNCFEGETDFSKLPHSLRDFDVSNNVDLEGSVQIDANEAFPNIRLFDFSDTEICGTIFVNQENAWCFDVENSKVKIIMTE